MMLLHVFTVIACLIILASALWACLSQRVFDGLLLKLCLGLTTLSAYIEIALPSERALDVLVIAIAGVCIASTVQRYILRQRLFHRPGEKSGARYARSA